MNQKRRRGRPSTQPPGRQSIHLRLAPDVYAPLIAWSRASGVPMNTLIERAVRAALERKNV